MHRKAFRQGIAGVAVLGLLALSGCAKPNLAAVPGNIGTLKQQAAMGNPLAANNLGVMYANGNGVPQDFAEARKCYLVASEHGNPAGEMNLALAYQRGQGTPVNMPEALTWYQLAVSHHFAPAMFSLAMLYRNGTGVPRDMNETVRLVRSSAIGGYPVGQAFLAGLYLEGVDVQADDGLAYEWASLAASKLTGALQTIAKKVRDDAEKGMTPADLQVAQAATASWTPGTDLTSPFKPGGPPHPIRIRGTGSGFVVGRRGEIATDFHVVPNCREVRLKDAAGRFNTVSHVIAQDRDNDLALVAGGGFGTRLKISSTAPALGETIVTYGFPLGPMLSSTGNMTTGSISSTAGMQEDTKLFQISAPVQPGSSGGPVVDESGAVVGIVESKLNALVVAAATGDITQNVNFAKRTGPLRTLMSRQGIVFELAGKGAARPMTDLADELQKASVKIECWR